MDDWKYWNEYHLQKLLKERFPELEAGSKACFYSTQFHFINSRVQIVIPIRNASGMLYDAKFIDLSMEEYDEIGGK